MNSKRFLPLVSIALLAMCAVPLAAQGPFPNLEPTAFSAPACAEVGEAVGAAISVVVTNSGAATLLAPAAPTTCGGETENTCSPIGFYLSTDATITTADTLLVGGRENLYSILGGTPSVTSSPFPVGGTVSDFLFTGAEIPSGLTGNVFIGVLADEFDSVTESIESDNDLSQPILIVAAGSGGCGSPDLIVDSLTHDPASPDTDDNITFTAVVKNIGGAIAPASTLSFKIGGESPSSPAALFAVPALAPGATHVQVRNLVLSVAQNYLNTAVADFNEDVAESNETNNTTTDSYTVTQVEPDLIVDSLTHAPASPDTETDITFTAVVKNIGTGSAGASTLSFKIGGESPSSPSALFPVPSLAPGASHTETRNLVLTVAQNYLNTAVADFNEDVAESNESNNTTTDAYTVTEVEEPGPAFAFKILTLPVHGILRDSTGAVLTSAPVTVPDRNVRYEPNTGYKGVDKFTYELIKGGLPSVDPGTIFLDIVGPVCTICANLVVEFPGSGDGDVTPNPQPQSAGGDVVVCNADCSLSFNPGAEVTLQARPVDDSDVFVGWSGACAAAGSNQLATITLPVGGTTTCVATFDEVP